jgi:pyruvate kinase
MRDHCLDRLMQIRGATKRLAEGLGISTAAVSQWERVPRERVVQAAAILGVSPRDLRPDLYPANEPAEAA